MKWSINPTPIDIETNRTFRFIIVIGMIGFSDLSLKPFAGNYSHYYIQYYIQWKGQEVGFKV